MKSNGKTIGYHKTFNLAELRALAQRTAELKQTIDHLKRRLSQEELIANRALHDLGVAREEDNVLRFIDRYRRELLKVEREDLMT